MNFQQNKNLFQMLCAYRGEVATSRLHPSTDDIEDDVRERKITVSQESPHSNDDLTACANK